MNDIETTDDAGEDSVSEHTRLACQAAYEIQTIAAHLQSTIEDSCRGEEIEILSRGMLMRISDLSDLIAGLNPDIDFGPANVRIENARRTIGPMAASLCQ